MEIVIILILIGILSGVISSLTGIGGGVFYISTMVFLIAIPIDEARDTSTFIIVIFSGVAFFRYFKQGKIDLKLCLIFATFAIFGGITATIVFIIFPLDNLMLKIVIATVVIISGINMIYKAIITRNSEKKTGIDIDEGFTFENFDYKANLKKGIPLFFLSGFIAYLTGVGGGIVNVPALNIFLGLPIHNATAVSTAIIFFVGIYNTIARIFLGVIHYYVGVLIATGAVIGALIGTKLSNKIPKSSLQFLVAFVLIGLAIRLYFA